MEGNVWRRKKLFLFVEMKNEEGKGGKGLKKENIFFLSRRRKRRKMFGEGKCIE